MRERRQRDVRGAGCVRGGRARLRRCEVARRVAARRAGLLAAGVGVASRAGAAGLTVVVVTVAAGRGAARTTTRAAWSSPGPGRAAARCDPLGAASGLAGCWAPAGTAAASDAATTIATQRRCALAPMSTNRTFGRIDRTPGCAALQPLTHPFGWVSGRWPAGRPTQNRPTGPCRAVSPPSFAWTGSRTFFRHAAESTGALARDLARRVAVARRRQRQRGVGLQDRATAARAVHPHRRVGVARVVLLRRGVRMSALAVPGLLAQRLDVHATPPGGLVGRLGGLVVVAGRGLRRRRVDLLDVTVVAACS